MWHPKNFAGGRFNPTQQLRYYHRNPRKGDVNVITDSIIQNGIYKPLVVNRGTHTGRPMEVACGNHTLKALQQLGTPTADCWVIDVTEEQLARIVTVDNRASDLATYNDETLLDILQDLPDLTGTGYTDNDLADLIASMTGEELEPEDDPTPNPYEDFITIRMQLPPHLAQQWLALSNGFDSPEEALEYLLDNRVSEH
ncbi:transcriptional regulator [Corynebacterium diphtheriae]|nr:transcriptional regulator [Corynebacterium diphtheriae]RLP10406.1 transcriptional regulator [Corynebacterium diphtheriae]